MDRLPRLDDLNKDRSRSAANHGLSPDLVSIGCRSAKLRNDPERVALAQRERAQMRLAELRCVLQDGPEYWRQVPGRT